MSSVSTSGRTAWDPGSGRWQTAPAESPDPAFAAVDSWLVDGGRVRGLDHHRGRFVAAAARADAHPFFDAAVGALPRAGRWFPRVECVAATGELRLALRPAPPRLAGVVVAATPVPDPRRAPRVKGPDLPMQHALRSAAIDAGAGEALLAAPDGTVVEGVWTSLLWWDSGALCALPEDAPALGSVTRALLLDHAAATGVAVRRAAPTVAELQGAETWLVSALHGVRLVTGWHDGGRTLPGAAPADPGRAATWQRELEALARPLG